MRALILPFLTILSLATPLAGFGRDVLLWPEAQRAFLQDGPGFLLGEDERQRFVAASEEVRVRLMEDFFAPSAELREGVRRRQQLIREMDLSPIDVRSRLLFLHGKPDRRRIVDCAMVFRPLELWTYGDPKDGVHLLVHQPSPDEMWRVWLPTDGKRALYTTEMEYFLDQWEELRRYITGRRFDYQICKEAKEVDEITGVSGLTGYEKDRPTNQEMQRFLEPPEDLEGWARKAAGTPVKEPPPELVFEELIVSFPSRSNQRMVARTVVMLPAESGIEVATETEEPELDLSIEATIEREETIFDSYRVRFNPKAPEEPTPLALVTDRPLRPGQSFLLRMEIKDEVGGATTWVNRGFLVPTEPDGSDLAAYETAEDLVVAVAETISQERIGGKDGLLIVPPESEVVVGLWRAEVLVTGERITKVVILVDDKVQLTRTRPPFTAEVRLQPFPTEQVVRAEGYDANGDLVLSDEVTLNQPRGALRVRITEPRPGTVSKGQVQAKAQVVVPEERRVEKVEFLLGATVIASLDKPPWEAPVTVPEGGELAYLTVTAELDDGSRAEDVRFLNNPQFLEEVDVNLVELYTTVTDNAGGLVSGLQADDFQVFEEGRRQELAKFELVNNLPLTIGLALDTSGSMSNALYEARRAAAGFLDEIVTRRDRCFALGFADHPFLLMPPTNDVDAVARSLEGLLADGFTSLHDALVHALYYFRGFRGRKALVLLSDGDDTSSNLTFAQALEYSRYSGVVIYTIGLDVNGLNLGVRDKLKELSRETGGRSFFIKKAEELADVYQAIENELRSQYLLAYASDRQGADDGYRTVEVKMKKRSMKARTARGYYE